MNVGFRLLRYALVMSSWDRPNLWKYRMVDIIEGRSGSLLYQALTPGVEASYILSLLFTDFQAQGGFFLISDTGVIATADEALDAGRYYAVRKKGEFELEMKQGRGVQVLRTEVDLGDIFDHARETGMEGEWLGLAEQRLFAVQEQGLALYQALHLHCTSLLAAHSSFSHWFRLGRSLLLHISPFLDQCQACAKALLHQISLCPAPESVSSFVQQLKTEGETRPLGKWVVEAGLDKRYSHIYSRTEVKLKKVLLSLEEYKERKVGKAMEELENAWSTTQSLLSPSLQAAETLPQALLWLRTVVSAYSSLRDAIEEDTSSELQQAPVSLQITALEGELQVWRATAELVAAGEVLADTDVRLAKYVRRAADVATELTTRLKVQFLGKEAALTTQIGKLKDLSRYFDREVLVTLTVQLESEVVRRGEYEARVAALWGQLQAEVQTEQQLRTAFVSSVGAYIPANCHLLPADSPTVAAVHSLAVSCKAEKLRNDANGSCSKEGGLAAELEAARKALNQERVQKHLFESNLVDLTAESRLLLSSALSQSQDLLKREISKLGVRQVAYLKDLRNQLSTL